MSRRCVASLLGAGVLVLVEVGCREPNPDWLGPTSVAGPSTETSSSQGTTEIETDATTQAACVECGNQCVDLMSDPEHCGECFRDCDWPTRYCVAGECACQDGFAVCDDDCVDLTKNGNCGACDNSCPGDQVCRMGECKPNCASFGTECAGSCVDLQTDEEHCGECGEDCFSDELCIEGVCVDQDPD